MTIHHISLDTNDLAALSDLSMRLDTEFVFGQLSRVRRALPAEQTLGCAHGRPPMGRWFGRTTSCADPDGGAITKANTQMQFRNRTLAECFRRCAPRALSSPDVKPAGEPPGQLCAQYVRSLGVRASCPI